MTEDALEAVADQALLRGTGARGLRAILEEVLLDVMYDLPGRNDIGKCVVDRAVVLEGVQPDARPAERTAGQGRPEPPGRLVGSARGRAGRTPLLLAGRGASAWLDGHIDFESQDAERRALPTLDRIRELPHLMGNPERTYPSVHLTGTNAKGSTAAMITVAPRGDGAGASAPTRARTCTRVNERIARNGEPIDDERPVPRCCPRWPA